ncbi:hypothetical protein HDF19_19730 [Mucilaginibacter sp. E4BP6]|uniref:hypothetical protein n=1 Tax=Mucilaginibacter sp. E4BP6 TaxID=2723089 RepID=UPI0015C976B9|nr:hypothetical protein [Mucilaginibacter sp. E4BP6]NYE67221.1 hypothetical protein [Mucilaginibacter sp. E4BP6]
MINIRKYPGLNPNSKIIADLDMTFYKALKTAFERGQKSIWQRILQHNQTQVIIAISKDSLPVLQQSIFLPVYFFHVAKKNQEVVNELVKDTALSYKTISYAFRSDARPANLPEISDYIINKFIEGVLAFFHTILFIEDEKVLLNAINELNQMNDDKYDAHTRFKIEDIINGGGTQEQAKALRFQEDLKSLYAITQRRAILGLKSWIMFLYSLNEMPEDRLLLLEVNIELQYQFFEDLLSDVIFIRKYNHVSYLGLSDWDYTERQDMKVYSPPSVYDWLLHGLCLYLLKGNAPHVMMSVILDDDDHAFLFEAVKKQLDEYKLNLPKWYRLFGLAGDSKLTSEQEKNQILESYEERTRKILTVFEQLKINHDVRQNQELVAESLDIQRINEFKERLKLAWKKQCFIYDLFDHFQNVVIKKSEKGLQFFGANILLPRFKMMFVENNFQQIYGSADLAADIGRRTSNSFLSLLTPMSVDAPLVEDLVANLDKHIKDLTDKGFPPNLIIIPPEFSYRTGLLKLPDFKQKVNPEDLSDFGSYRDIPIVTFYSGVLSNQVILTKFDMAFELDIYQNKEWYDNRLYLNLKELSEGDINKEFEKDKAAWKKDEKGFDLTDAQAKLRIETSLYLEIWSKGRFRIKEPKAFEIFKLKI